MQNNALGVVKHRHVDNSATSENHIFEVRVQGEVIADRTYAVRQLKFLPWKQFTICGQRVDWLQGSCVFCLRTTCLQKDGGLE